MKCPDQSHTSRISFASFPCQQCVLITRSPQQGQDDCTVDDSSRHNYDNHDDAEDGNTNLLVSTWDDDDCQRHNGTISFDSIFRSLNEPSSEQEQEEMSCAGIISLTSTTSITLDDEDLDDDDKNSVDDHEDEKEEDKDAEATTDTPTRHVQFAEEIVSEVCCYDKPTHREQHKLYYHANDYSRMKAEYVWDTLHDQIGQMIAELSFLSV